MRKPIQDRRIFDWNKLHLETEFGSAQRCPYGDPWPCPVVVPPQGSLIEIVEETAGITGPEGDLLVLKTDQVWIVSSLSMDKFGRHSLVMVNPGKGLSYRLWVCTSPDIVDWRGVRNIKRPAT
jgi:hypothetical protein